jgi:hypothetical protein
MAQSNSFSHPIQLARISQASISHDTYFSHGTSASGKAASPIFPVRVGACKRTHRDSGDDALLGASARLGGHGF